MFKHPFSFKGRIRRTEFAISYIVFYLMSHLGFLEIGSVCNIYINNHAGTAFLFLMLIVYVLILWFFIAQSVKRCRDIGTSVWWLLNPFYVIVLFFTTGNNVQMRREKNPIATQN